MLITSLRLGQCPRTFDCHNPLLEGALAPRALLRPPRVWIELRIDFDFVLGPEWSLSTPTPS